MLLPAIRDRSFDRAISLESQFLLVQTGARAQPP
jgi:hypothetical protein